MTADDVAAKIAAETPGRLKDHRGHRAMWAAIGITVLGLLVAVLAAVVYVGETRSRDADQDRTISALEAVAEDNGAIARQLSEQIRGMGGTPAVVAPEPGERGPRGEPGEIGRTGLPGRDGRDGVDGQSPPCLAEPTQCRGTDGVDGRNGVDGRDGANGTPGVDGSPGADGAPGERGPDGAPGPTCPTGYEPRPALIVGPDGSTYQGVACVDPSTSTPPLPGNGNRRS
ncbi:Flagellar hook-length control protein FliK [Alloactinosynnema sp. L-07]|uniref:hypothetical protein n=1 Tax=Alloactinosynnema sp. L-07 TaxID=1653480 RepID=UPI00065EFADD|nr:hypothetical protein [Alloactinosynnema sp. L-07]CRK59086.1 Flagellar hook-length control protein FliK [Alloactinosynnema sp. L-07]